MNASEQKTVLIVGMAKSGIGAAKLLAGEGMRVIVNDMKPEIPGLEEALSGIPYENRLGEDPTALLDGVDLIVPSPVIPQTKPFLTEARRRGIEIASEIELGWRYADPEASFVCITGTNGKTTCTALTGEMFKAGGFHTWVLGNIGIAITKHSKDTRPGDVVVAETAALQLEACSRFHARAAACCNVTPDHLDHFGTMENYTAAKNMVYMNQTERDFAVFNDDDPVVRAMSETSPAKHLFFSRLHEVENGAFLRDGVVMLRMDGTERPLIRADEIRIPGLHNLENAMLCSLLALSMGVPAETIAEVLKTFPGVEHRIEYVRTLNGVRYINDSKGTNPDATVRAVQAMTGPTVLFLGGYDKHLDLHPLFDELRASGKIKAMVMLGQTRQQFLDTAADVGMGDLCYPVDTFKEAVDTAKSLAVPGDTVLLSPASASWGMFENFEQRGEIFKQIVNGYPEE